MRKRKWGRIINISGLAGRQPHYPVVPAALNNSAMLNLTKALAAELAKDNILVNAVVPYIIDTERQDDTMREWAKTTGQTEAEVREAARLETSDWPHGPRGGSLRGGRLHGLGARKLCRRHRLVCRRRRFDDALSMAQRFKSCERSAIQYGAPLWMFGVLLAMRVPDTAPLHTISKTR